MLVRLLQKLALPLLLLAAAQFSLSAAPARAAEKVGAADQAKAEQAKIVDARIGFAGAYKLGAWTPVAVTINGLELLRAPRLEVLAPDGDGSPAVVATAPHPGPDGRVRTLTRVGRRDATIRLRLLDGDQLIDQWRSGRDLDAPVHGLPAATPLIVEAGRQLPLTDLPTDWLAYEGVDVLVFSGLAPQDLGRISPEQATAIETWVRSGGRLVLGGGEHAEALVGAAGPLRALTPGVFVETVRVSNTGVLEDYAGSEQAIDAPFGGLPAGRLGGVTGVVELYAGGRASEMPLVVRSLYGFGSVTYTAFDLFSPALTEWQDFDQFRSLLLQTDLGESERATSSGPIVATAYEDLTGAVHVKLGSGFAGVQTISILMLVAAVLGYLALLGPGAYYFGKNVTGRMTTAWVYLPLLALFVAGATAWWGRASTGDTARLNKLELVDIDCQSGLERGAAWAQLFSPSAELYDLTCAPQGPNPAEDGYLSWFGLPGHGLGGMQTPAGSLLAGGVRYQTRPTLDGLSGVPINRRASKPLTARWLLENQPTIQFDLAPTGTGLVEGVLTNNTPLTLTDVKLIANNWAWRLPDLKPGEPAVVDASVSAARLRTLVLKDFGGDEQGARRLTPDRLSLPAIAYLLMFYDALDGEDMASLPAFRQTNTDLSHALAAGRPILVARADSPRCEIEQSAARVTPPTEPQGAFYRFLGPPLTDPNLQ